MIKHFPPPYYAVIFTSSRTEVNDGAKNIQISLDNILSKGEYLMRLSNETRTAQEGFIVQ